MTPTPNQNAQQRRQTRHLVGKIGLITAAAFAFCFALVPLYNIACEQIFGIRPDGQAVDVRGLDLNRVDTSRTVTVQFDATVNSELDWEFGPELPEIQVHPGQVVEAWYLATNITGDAIVGNATYDVVPKRAIPFFSKTECFCFTEQMLGPGETRRMPVRFFVAPDLPERVNTVTLSYTFYNNEAATRREQARLAEHQAAAAQSDSRG